MDAIRHITWFFVKIAVAVFAFALLWWLVSIIFPDINLRKWIFVSKGEDILPSPRQFSGLFGKAKLQTATTNRYVHGTPFNGYGLGKAPAYPYTAYTYQEASEYMDDMNDDGTFKSDYSGAVNDASVQGVTADTTVHDTVAYTRSLYVRNLSIYEGKTITNGLVFIGEARSTLFKNGAFPIVIIDHSGRVIGRSVATAQTVWSIPGWVRFQAKIAYTLSTKAPCGIIFEEALTQTEAATRKPLRLPISMLCN